MAEFARMPRKEQAAKAEATHGKGFAWHDPVAPQICGESHEENGGLIVLRNMATHGETEKPRHSFAESQMCRILRL